MNNSDKINKKISIKKMNTNDGLKTAVLAIAQELHSTITSIRAIREINP